MDYPDVKSALIAAEGAVEQARQRLMEAQAVLAEVRVIENRNRSILISDGEQTASAAGEPAREPDAPSTPGFRGK